MFLQEGNSPDFDGALDVVMVLLPGNGSKSSAVDLLKGNDSVGTACTVTLRRAKDNKITTVTLHRMENVLLSHKRKMADILRRTGDRFKKSKVFFCQKEAVLGFVSYS